MILILNNVIQMQNYNLFLKKVAKKSLTYDENMILTSEKPKLLVRILYKALIFLVKSVHDRLIALVHLVFDIVSSLAYRGCQKAQ